MVDWELKAVKLKFTFREFYPLSKSDSVLQSTLSKCAIKFFSWWEFRYYKFCFLYQTSMSFFLDICFPRAQASFLSSVLSSLLSWLKIICQIIIFNVLWQLSLRRYMTLWWSLVFVYLCTLVLLFSPKIVPFYIFNIKMLVSSHTCVKLNFINFISLLVFADTMSKILLLF